MSPALARPLLHTVHLLTFAALFVTGLLLLIPSLRAAVTGGYSLAIREAHRWGGVAFVVVPAGIIAQAGLRNVFIRPAHPSIRTRWQGFHLALTAMVSVVFVLTGFVLWGKRSLPDTLVELSRGTHDWLTYVAAALLGVHLLEIGLAALVERFHAAALTAGPPQP